MESRAKNFSSKEIEALLELVKSHSDILESKQTNRVSADEKEACWKTIEKAFNAKMQSNSRCCLRTWSVLRTKYLNLKSDLKKRCAAEKRSLYITGGGPSEKTSPKLFDNLLNEIVPQKQISGHTSKYDNDAATNEAEKNEKTACKDLENSLNEIDNDANIIVEDDNDDFETSFKVKKLDEPKSKKLCFVKKNQNASTWINLARIKSKWTEEKFKTEIFILKAEHETKAALFKERHDLEIAMMKEKHAIEMDILKENLQHSKKH